MSAPETTPETAPGTALETARLARVLMTAVNQQFGHVMILRAKGRDAIADGITKTDKFDFPVSMRLLERVVTAGDVDPWSEAPSIGHDEASILAAEHAMENRLDAAINAAEAADVPFTAGARAARADHRAWLRTQTAAAFDDPCEPAPPSDILNQGFRLCLGLMEQSLAHAYVHRARQAEADADAAWAISGSAMTIATRLSNILTARGLTPHVAEPPPLRFSRDPMKAIELDRAAARDVAAWHADTADIEMARRDRAVLSKYCGALGDWPPGAPPAALKTAPPIFLGFETMHRRIGL